MRRLGPLSAVFNQLGQLFSHHQKNFIFFVTGQANQEGNQIVGGAFGAQRQRYSRQPLQRAQSQGQVVILQIIQNFGNWMDTRVSYL